MVVMKILHISQRPLAGGNFAYFGWIQRNLAASLQERRGLGIDLVFPETPFQTILLPQIYRTGINL
jgi:hypothetical protein